MMTGKVMKIERRQFMAERTRKDLLLYRTVAQLRHLFGYSRSTIYNFIGEMRESGRYAPTDILTHGQTKVSLTAFVDWLQVADMFAIAPKKIKPFDRVAVWYQIRDLMLCENGDLILEAYRNDVDLIDLLAKEKEVVKPEKVYRLKVKEKEAAND